jgi:hypothetical protein
VGGREIRWEKENAEGCDRHEKNEESDPDTEKSFCGNHTKRTLI